MKFKSLIVTALWLGSLAAAYYFGAGDRSGQLARTPSADEDASGTSGDRQATDRPKVSRQFGGGDDLDPEKKLHGVLMLAGNEVARINRAGMGVELPTIVRLLAPVADLPESQIPEALAVLERAVPDRYSRGLIQQMLIGRWAERDGKAALQYALEKKLDPQAQSTALAIWAHSDPEAAWRWFQAGEFDAHTRIWMTGQIFANLADHQPEVALERLRTVPEAEQTAALGAVARAASTDAARRQLLERSAALPENLRTEIFRQTASQWAVNDPDGAIQWVRSLPAEQQAHARETVGQMLLARRHNAQDADFLLEGAKPEARPAIYEQIVGRWAYQDPKEAGDWLAKQPQGPELDTARQTLAVNAARLDPPTAMTWAISVQDPSLRSSAVGRVYMSWRLKDAAAAQAALEASGIPGERIKSLLAIPPDKPKANP